MYNGAINKSFKMRKSKLEAKNKGSSFSGINESPKNSGPLSKYQIDYYKRFKVGKSVEVINDYVII